MISTIVREDLERVLRTIPEQIQDLVSSDLVITGATGFVGKWLAGTWLIGAQEFGGRGRLFLTARNPKIILETYDELRGNPRVMLHSSDIRHLEIPKHFAGCTLIHGATAASEQLNLQEPDEMIDVVVHGTKKVLAECRRLQAKKFVFLSSGAVYGHRRVGEEPCSEDDRTGPELSDSRNAYHEAKRLAELLTSIEREELGIEALSLRLFTFVGPYLPLDRHFAVGIFIRQALQDRVIRVESGGGSVRSYQYGADLVRDIVYCTTNDMKFSTYNVGSPDSISIKDLADLVAMKVGDDVRVEILGEDDPRTTSAYVPSTTRLSKECPYTDTIDLSQGVVRTASFNQVGMKP